MIGRALFIAPTDYDDLCRKGVSNFLHEREAEADFDRVVTVHPWAKQTRTIDISPKHRLYEFRELFLPFGRRYKLLRYVHHAFHILRLTVQLVRILHREKIDFIRATDPIFTGSLAYLATRVIPRPFCVSIHADYDIRSTLDPDNMPFTLFGSRKLSNRIEQFIFGRAQLVMPIRQYIADKLVQKGLPREKVRVIPHGIDLGLYQNPPTVDVRAAFRIPTGVPILSFAGRLSHENYIYDVLALAAKLKDIRQDFVIVIAGDGYERPGVEKTIARDRTENFVTLVGSQPQPVVAALRRASAASLCLMGGFSLIEACAAGRPVIAYDVEWHSELVRPKETGYLVEEHNVDGVVNAVLDLLDHPDTANRLGRAAQTLAWERHDIRKTSQLKSDYYRELSRRVTTAAS